LNDFRNGDFDILVATDVAARGLDIEGVDLVIQTYTPNDTESYIHRSGRTGRAGKAGISILMYDRYSANIIPQLEDKANIEFTHIDLNELRQFSSEMFFEQICIHAKNTTVLELFTPRANKLIEKLNGDPIQALAGTLAALTGYGKEEKDDNDKFSNGGRRRRNGGFRESRERGGKGGRGGKGRGGRGEGGRGGRGGGRSRDRGGRGGDRGGRGGKGGRGGRGDGGRGDNASSSFGKGKGKGGRGQFMNDYFY